MDKKHFKELCKRFPTEVGGGVDDWLDEEEFKAFVGEPDESTESKSEKSMKRKRR